MTRPTLDEHERRLAFVEAAIGRAGGWSLALERRIAKELGVTTRSVRRMRVKVEDRVRKTLDAGDVKAQRAALLVKVRAGQRAAMRDGKHGPYFAGLGMEARMLGILDPPEVAEPDNLEAASRDDLLAELARDLTPDEVAALVELKGL